jgi:HK97 family phage major capsid protein
VTFVATTPTSAAAWRPDEFVFAPVDVVGDAIILQTSTATKQIEGDAPSVRAAFVVDDQAILVPESELIDQAAPQLSEVVIHTSKVSMLIKLSKEQYLQAETSAQLALSVSRALVRRADIAYLAEPAPTGPAVAPVAGITNVAGIIDGGSVVNDLDVLVDLVAALQANLGTPTAFVVGPLGWAELRKFKTASTFNTSLLGAGTEDAQQMLLGLPVLVNRAITDYSGLVLDQLAVVNATGPVSISTSLDRYFDEDCIAIKGTWRTGHAVVHPTRIGKFSIIPEGS